MNFLIAFCCVFGLSFGNKTHLSGGGMNMVRMSIAGVAGFILVFIESYIVMQLKGYQTIEFGGISPFVSVWAMNFFLLFSILTQVKEWYLRQEEAAEESYTD